jgi:hypothetical protein
VAGDILPLARRVRCRQIGVADLDDIADLLTVGFRARSRDFWVHTFKRLSSHPTPDGYPKYGYLLDCNGAAVGVVLLIYSSVFVDGVMIIRCSMSSWYVKSGFRSYAAMLNSHATSHKRVTYFNITPGIHIRPILEAQGFSRYCNGRFVTAPALIKSKGYRVKVVAASDACTDENLSISETELLRAHAKYGCVSLICDSERGTDPFVFLPLRKAHVLPFAYLAYCRNVEDFTRCAGSLGRFLAARGYPFVVIDANGPIDGLVGAYLDGAPKYFKGPYEPRLGDLAYSERVLFGF